MGLSDINTVVSQTPVRKNICHDRIGLLFHRRVINARGVLLAKNNDFVPDADFGHISDVDGYGVHRYFTQNRHSLTADQQYSMSDTLPCQRWPESMVSTDGRF